MLDPDPDTGGDLNTDPPGSGTLLLTSLENGGKQWSGSVTFKYRTGSTYLLIGFGNPDLIQYHLPIHPFLNQGLTHQNMLIEKLEVFIHVTRYRTVP